MSSVVERASMQPKRGKAHMVVISPKDGKRLMGQVIAIKRPSKYGAKCMKV